MISFRQAALWCGGAVLPQEEARTFSGIRNDSRELQPGNLFAALQGVRDGHDFIPAALEKGAAGALGARRIPGVPMIVVPDPLKAMGDLAREYRKTLGAKVIGVTGSVGKTTTKEMISAVLETAFVTQHTEKNYNNDIGVPITVLDLRPDCEAAVVEMGMNHAGEISYLSKIARPDVAVITCIGTAHIGNLGSRENICRAKLEILDGMDADGTVILNGDDDLLQKAGTGRKTLYFGLSEGCDLRAEEIREEDGETRFTAVGLGRRFPVVLPVAGVHNVRNALSAILVGLVCGAEPEQIVRGLAGFRNTGNRQNIYQQDGYTVIADCYNAGPESMAASLSVLAGRKTAGRRIAVLGDMLELGEHGPEAHRRVGEIAAQCADLVLAFGPLSAGIAEAAGEKGRHFDSREAMTAALREAAQPGDVLLFKGSHGMHLEKVLEAFFIRP